MNRFTLALLLVALSIGVAVTSGVDIDTEKFKEVINISDIDITIDEYPELEHALEYFMNGLVKGYMELMKWAVDFAANNPQIPYKALLYLLILSLVAPIIIVLFKLGVIIFLLVKEHKQNKKDKRELKRIKNELHK